MLTTLTVVAHEDRRRSEQLELSRRLLHHLGFNPDQLLKIIIGKTIHTVNIKLNEKVPFPEMYLSKEIMADFILPVQSLTLQAKPVSALNTLYLGPVIGLLTDPPSNQNEQPFFRSIHSFCEELAQKFAEIGGLFYVFTYKDFTAHKVSGYYWNGEEWEFSNLPLPDVIYNRVHSRKLEQMKLFQKFREAIDQLNIPFFNDRFLSKWEVYHHLSHQEKIVPYLPETELFSTESLIAFLEKYPAVFLKPVHGSQGRNIIKISKDNDVFHCQTSLNTQSDQPIQYPSAEELLHQLQSLLTKRAYIIQQAIPLAAHQSRTIDYRVLCHKNTADLWQVTSIVARMSGEQQFVSNIARGGEIIKPQTALEIFFPKKAAAEILLLMKELALEAAAAISQNSAGLTGELGIDIGVDPTGRLWLIEINSKPSKNFEQPAKGRIRPSTKAIVQLCTSLAFDLSGKKEG